MNKTNPQVNKEIGNRLHEIRIVRGYTQKEMSIATNLNQNQISLIECGKSKASVEVLLKYCSVLDVTPSEILGYTETRCEHCYKIEAIRKIISD